MQQKNPKTDIPLLCPGQKVVSAISTPREKGLLALDSLQPLDDDLAFILLHVAGGGIAQVTFQIVTLVQYGWLLPTACGHGTLSAQGRPGVVHFTAWELEAKSVVLVLHGRPHRQTGAVAETVSGLFGEICRVVAGADCRRTYRILISRHVRQIRRAVLPREIEAVGVGQFCRRRPKKVVLWNPTWRGGGIRCSYVDLFLLVVAAGFATHLGRRHAHGHSDRYVDQIVPDANSGPSGQFERSVIGLFERFDHVPRLALHDGNLPCEHAFFEIGVQREHPPQSQLSLAPPGGRGEQGKEVFSSPFRKGLSDKGHGKEEPAERETPPLATVSRKKKQPATSTYSVGVLPGPRQTVVNGPYSYRALCFFPSSG